MSSKKYPPPPPPIRYPPPPPIDINWDINLVYGANLEPQIGYIKRYYENPYSHLKIIYLNDIKISSVEAYRISLNSITLNTLFDFTDYAQNFYQIGRDKALIAYREEVRKREQAWRIRKQKRFPRLDLKFKIDEEQKRMKGSKQFKEVIEAHLKKKASKDLLFMKKLKDPNKSIDECIEYILGEVQKSGCNGFDDAEVFGWANHYYDEKDLKVTKSGASRVVVNHHVELTEEEKKDAKEKAIREVIENEKKRLKQKPGSTKQEDLNSPNEQASLF